jgi:hypothetical protein
MEFPRKNTFSQKIMLDQGPIHPYKGRIRRQNEGRAEETGC